MKVKIGDEIISYNIEYGSRKKIVISIDSVGFVTVKAPKGINQEDIEKEIQKNSKPIKDRLDLINRIKEGPSTRAYDGQGKFLYLGKEYDLHELIDVNGLNEEEAKKELKNFYVSSCKKIIQERIKPYEQELRVKHKGFDIVDSIKKWGSCDSHKKLTFNYRLAMAPLEVIDYLIVHELCHLVHMNHDRSFWRLVGSVIRDYKKSERYLMYYGSYMTF